MKKDNAQDLDAIIRKIQALLARADHPNTPKAEAESCRAKVEALMFKYRIEEVATDSDSGNIRPVIREVRICRMDNEFRDYYSMMFGSCLRHFDGMGATKMSIDENGDAWDVVVAAGYESDLRFAEILFLSASLEFSKNLEPEYDPEQSDQVNAYRMRLAGMSGRAIAMKIYGRDDKHLRPKVRKMFRDESVVRGEDPEHLLGKGVNVARWREDYATGFSSEFGSRLFRMRSARGEFEGGVVLAGRKEAVVERFYEEFPHLRPSSTASTWTDPTKTCQKCQRAKSGYCRDHSYLRPRYKTVRVDRAARQAGAEAARKVDLGQGSSGGRIAQ